MKPEEKKEPKPAFNIPVDTVSALLRWLAYAICFFILLMPFKLSVWEWICGALILAWFAGLLNEIKEKRK